MMIIPSIFVFEGMDGMKAGPSLMFISLPKVFASMPVLGRGVGLAFFLMAAFAALTSCVSVLETITANCMEIFHTKRKSTTIVLTLVYTAASVIVALGYSLLYVEIKLPTGSIGQILDLMDYISSRGGRAFGLKGLFSIMIKYVVPVIMFILFLESAGILNV